MPGARFISTVAVIVIDLFGSNIPELEESDNQVGALKE